MFSVSVEGLEKEIFTLEDLQDDLKLELIKYSKDVIVDEVKLGFPKDPVVIVDGKYNKKVEDVKPFGKIQFINTDVDIIDDLRLGFDRILELSPKGSKNKGDRFSNVKYYNHNYVYFNNILVAQNKFELNRWLQFIESKGFKRGDVIAFVNVVPYARKLESLGITKATVGRGGKKIRTRKTRNKTAIARPNGVYYSAQRTIKRLLLGRAYVNPVKYVAYDIAVQGMRNHYETGRPYLYPTIIVKPITGKGVVQ